MKIVFFTFVYYPIVGGIQVYIKQIADYLVNKGHEVCIITADKTVTCVEKDVLDGARIIRIPAFDIGGFYFIKKREHVLDLIGKEIEKADIVHENAPKLLYKYFAKKKKYGKYRLIVTSHGWFYHTNRYRIIKDLYFKNVIVKYAGYYDGIINVSLGDQIIAEKFGLKKSCVIENGVDIYKYANAHVNESFSNRFVYYGRIDRNKGIFECLKKLKEYSNTFIFDVIGNCSDKAYFNKIKTYVENNKLEQNVKFWGNLSDERIKLFIDKSDFILMPSLREGFGMALAECLLSGKPIIANDNEAFHSILSSVGAEDYLFDFDSPESNIEKKITELRQFRIKPQNVEQYSVKKMIDKTLIIYGL